LILPFDPLWLTIGGLALALVVVALVILLILTMLRLRRLERRYQRLVLGTEGGSLGQVLEEHLANVRAALQEVAVLGQVTRETEARLRAAIRHVGLVRFNPFADTGGDLSFALALADDEGNGLVLCSLHGRSEGRIFAKPLAQWASSYTLSTEEAQAVSRAQAHATAAPANPTSGD
jgi:hypothetical protein